MFEGVAGAGVDRGTEESVITSSPARSAPAREGMLSGPPPVGMEKSSESTACQAIADPPATAGGNGRITCPGARRGATALNHAGIPMPWTVKGTFVASADRNRHRGDRCHPDGGRRSDHRGSDRCEARASDAADQASHRSIGAVDDDREHRRDAHGGDSEERGRG